MMVTFAAPPRPPVCQGMVIEEMSGMDVTSDFLDTLASLAPTRLTPQSALRVFQERLRAGHRTYVARFDGRVVGSATLLLDRKFIHGGGLVGHLEDVAVHQDWQGRGLGTALVRHATAAAQALGCYKVILNCHEPLVPFYERLQFRSHDSGMRIDFAP